MLFTLSYETERLWNYWEGYVMTEIDKPKQQEVESGENWGKQPEDAIWKAQWLQL